MKAKVFEMIITCLLSALLGMGIYFVKKLEACEVRIWTLETNTVDAKIDGIKDEIDLLKKLVLLLLDKNGLDTSKINRKAEALAEGRGE